MLLPFAAHAVLLVHERDWPRREMLHALLAAAAVTNARGMPLRVVAPDADRRVSYETRVYERGEVEVREGEWHDLFNVMAWLAYPLTKAALNERHVEAASAERVCAATPGAARGRNRGRLRDALTVFDESGAVFVSADAHLVEDLRAFRWKDLFWKRRERVRSAVRVYVFGHAMLEKGLQPYVGMTAHALPLVVGADFLAGPSSRELERVDALAARSVRDPACLTTPQSLAPLPLLGVPGWWLDNEREDFYDDATYFRPGRQNRREVIGRCPKEGGNVGNSLVPPVRPPRRTR